MAVHHVLPEIRATYTPDENKKKKKSNGRGYKLDRWRSSAKCLQSDLEILEMRWLYEYCGWSLKDIQNHYGLEYARAHKLVVSCITRTKIVAKKDSFPPGHKPQPKENP